GLSKAANAFGYFSGLMTEWYHVDETSANEQAATYSTFTNPQTSGVMWADEFNINDGQIYFDIASAPFSYSNSYKMTSLSSLPISSSMGTASNLTEFSNPRVFLTGP